MKHCLRDQYVFYYECGCFWFSFHHRWRILHAFFVHCVFLIFFFTRLRYSFLHCSFCIISLVQSDFNDVYGAYKAEKRFKWMCVYFSCCLHPLCSLHLHKWIFCRRLFASSGSWICAHILWHALNLMFGAAK